MSEQIENCPICNLPFATNVLEIHVNTCLDKEEGKNINDSIYVSPVCDQKETSKAVQVFSITKSETLNNAIIGALLTHAINMLKKYGEAKEEGGIGFSKKHIKGVLETKDFRIFEQELKKLQKVRRKFLFIN